MTLAVGDLTGDGLAEVVISDYRANAVMVYCNASKGAGGACVRPVANDDAAVLVEDAPATAIDVLTGDYLAELTLMILLKDRFKDANLGYARTFLRQLEEVAASCLQRGIKIVANAGGLPPGGSPPGPTTGIVCTGTSCWSVGTIDVGSRRRSYWYKEID